MSETIRAPKLADTIADHIRQMITEGALPPGAALLSDEALSAKLDVPQRSLREALDKLIGQGLLTRNSQGATHVSASAGRSLPDPLILLLDRPEARIDTMELRSVVEAEAAALAAERATDVDRTAITAAFDAMLAAHEVQDVESIARADAEFHFAIYEASHNLMMLHFARSLESNLRSNVYLNRKALYEHLPQLDSQLQEHQAIYDAIMARDAGRAREAASHHMITGMRIQRELYEADLRLAASIRRLARNDFVSGRKKQAAGQAG